MADKSTMRRRIARLEAERARLDMLARSLYAARDQLPEWARLRVEAMVHKGEEQGEK